MTLIMIALSIALVIGLLLLVYFTDKKIGKHLNSNIQKTVCRILDSNNTEGKLLFALGNKTIDIQITGTHYLNGMLNQYAIKYDSYVDGEKVFKNRNLMYVILENVDVFKDEDLGISKKFLASAIKIAHDETIAEHERNKNLNNFIKNMKK